MTIEESYNKFVTTKAIAEKAISSARSKLVEDILAAYKDKPNMRLDKAKVLGILEEGHKDLVEILRTLDMVAWVAYARQQEKRNTIPEAPLVPPAPMVLQLVRDQWVLHDGSEPLCECANNNTVDKFYTYVGNVSG